MEQPLTHSSLNVRREEIFEIREEVGAVSGSPIYAPFQNYGGRELRAQQGYLTKFPAVLVAYLFAVPIVAGAQVAPSSSAAVRKGGGQGYLSDAEKRGAIERYGVAKAIAHYREEGATEIEELGMPYGLRVVIGGVKRHVEMNGSISESIAAGQLTRGRWITPNAINRRISSSSTVWSRRGLRMVSSRRREGTPFVEDRRPDRGVLRPIHLRYTLPE